MSVLGLSEVPVAGEIFEVVESEKIAREVIAERIVAEEQQVELQAGPSLEEIFAQFQAGQAKTLNLIIKADVQGTLEPILDSLRKIEDW